MATISMFDRAALASGRHLTPRIAWAAAFDAGNRSMRIAGRAAWNEADRDAAVETYERLAHEGGFRVDEETRDPEALDRLLLLQTLDRELFPNDPFVSKWSK